MTIARRLLVLLAVPLLVLAGLGVFVRHQLETVESQTRFLAEKQVRSLALLGNVSRTFTELRVYVRSYLLTDDKADRASIQGRFAADKTALIRQLAEYGDGYITDDKDRRLFDEVRTLSHEYIVGAETVMGLADAGQRAIAVTTLTSGSLANIGTRISNASTDWIRHNEDLSVKAGRDSLDAIEESRHNQVIAVALPWRCLEALAC